MGNWIPKSLKYFQPHLVKCIPTLYMREGGVDNLEQFTTLVNRLLREDHEPTIDECRWVLNTFWNHHITNDLLTLDTYLFIFLYMISIEEYNRLFNVYTVLDGSVNHVLQQQQKSEAYLTILQKYMATVNTNLAKVVDDDSGVDTSNAKTVAQLNAEYELIQVRKDLRDLRYNYDLMSSDLVSKNKENDLLKLHISKLFNATATVDTSDDDDDKIDAYENKLRELETIWTESQSEIKILQKELEQRNMMIESFKAENDQLQTQYTDYDKVTLELVHTQKLLDENETILIQKDEEITRLQQKIEFMEAESVDLWDKYTEAQHDLQAIKSALLVDGTTSHKALKDLVSNLQSNLAINDDIIKGFRLQVADLNSKAAISDAYMKKVEELEAKMAAYNTTTNRHNLTGDDSKRLSDQLNNIVTGGHDNEIQLQMLKKLGWSMLGVISMLESEVTSTKSLLNERNSAAINIPKTKSTTA